MIMIGKIFLLKGDDDSLHAFFLSKSGKTKNEIDRIVYKGIPISVTSLGRNATLYQELFHKDRGSWITCLKGKIIVPRSQVVAIFSVED